MTYPDLSVSSRGARLAAAALSFSVLGACSTSAPGNPLAIAECSVPLESFTDGGTERSGIPALHNPKVALRGTPDIAYLSLADRVIGVEFNGQPLAIPHKLLWYHEVVNFEIPGERLAVTYAPLTGSSLVFDPAGAAESSFAVSSYVLNSNLVMEDASGTLWPQMLSAAGCGPRDGVSLIRIPHQEMSFGAWLSTHPDTWTVSSGTGFDFLYTLYPYGNYANTNNQTLRYPVEGALDTRRPPKEPVLGIPGANGAGVAVPLPLLAQAAAEVPRSLPGQFFVYAANAEVDGEPVTVFWNSAAAGGLAYKAEVNGQRLTFETVDNDRRDLQTGSSWNYQGAAFAGPLEGAQLDPIEDAYTSFWFAWSVFFPNTEVWEPEIPLSRVPNWELLTRVPDDFDWSLSAR